MEFKPFEENIDVIGQVVGSIFDGFTLFKKLPSKFLIREGIGKLNDEGIVEIDSNSWYSQHAWLNAFESISKEVGRSTLYKIGQKIPENAEFPPWVVDIDTAIKSIDIAYHLNHKKLGKLMFDINTGKMQEGIGHYGYERIIGKNEIISKCENPYPCEFDRGIINTMARRFEKKAKVIHDDSKLCRKKGDDSCTYIITW